MSKTIVNSNCPEFGYELLSSVPYAYNLFLKGDLKETISGFDTSCLYFFSPKHVNYFHPHHSKNIIKINQLNLKKRLLSFLTDIIKNGMVPPLIIWIYQHWMLYSQC